MGTLAGICTHGSSAICASCERHLTTSRLGRQLPAGVSFGRYSYGDQLSAKEKRWSLRKDAWALVSVEALHVPSEWEQRANVLAVQRPGVARSACNGLLGGSARDLVLSRAVTTIEVPATSPPMATTPKR